mmetsp:Transcript_20205/g.39969  ORF Transcript_20205/g.39969 Transcript_20205/m.39969 type:complete len:104 (+) Transcript_20205:273-584(+)
MELDVMEDARDAMSKPKDATAGGFSRSGRMRGSRWMPVARMTWCGRLKLERTEIGRGGFEVDGNCVIRHYLYFVFDEGAEGLYAQWCLGGAFAVDSRELVPAN